MLRTNWVIALATVIAGALLSVATVRGDDGKGRATAVQWDDGGLGPGGFQVALRDGDDDGPPGPPRGGDYPRTPPPRTFERNREPDGRQPPPPPRDGDERQRPPEGRPYSPAQPRGPDGGRPMPDAFDGPGMLRGGAEMEKRDPEMYKLLKADRDLERQTHELAMQYRRAASSEREQIKQQIDELVNKHFDVRQQRRALELKRLENELQRLREAIEKRASARAVLVEKRVSEVIGREDEIGF